MSTSLNNGAIGLPTRNRRGRVVHPTGCLIYFYMICISIYIIIVSLIPPFELKVTFRQFPKLIFRTILRRKIHRNNKLPGNGLFRSFCVAVSRISRTIRNTFHIINVLVHTMLVPSMFLLYNYTQYR